MSMIRKLVKDDSGATAIEYGLIAALVSVAIIVMLGALGDNLNATFKTVPDEFNTASCARSVRRYRRPSAADTVTEAQLRLS
jgi:pilus assembly protein Flp/PilA